MATAEDTMEYSEEETNTYFSDEKTYRHMAEESRLVRINTGVGTGRLARFPSERASNVTVYIVTYHKSTSQKAQTKTWG